MDERRTELIEALSGVFRRQGYAGASLSQLAAATGLGKATLYHHFPGGKDEMAAAALGASIEELDRLAFTKLNGKGSRNGRLEEFVAGFGHYVDGGTRACLVAALAGGECPAALEAEIHRATARWLDQLTGVFRDSGQSRKRASRSARELLGRLYGALALARMLEDPKAFRQALKHLPR